MEDSDRVYDPPLLLVGVVADAVDERLCRSFVQRIRRSSDACDRGPKIRSASKQLELIELYDVLVAPLTDVQGSESTARSAAGAAAAAIVSEGPTHVALMRAYLSEPSDDGSSTSK